MYLQKVLPFMRIHFMHFFKKFPKIHLTQEITTVLVTKEFKKSCKVNSYGIILMVRVNQTSPIVLL